MSSLAIVVVYMVKPENGWLLDLHLHQIARCTAMPYTLYGAPNGLSADLHARLAARPEVKLLDIPPIQGSGTIQHSYFLDRLVRAAVTDGADAVAVFHVDSFPIQPDWDRQLLATLSDACPLAAVQQAETKDFKPHGAGMIFRSEFYRHCAPTFLLDADHRAELEYQAYQQREPHFPDTGSGYGYALYRHGLAWRPLLRSNRANVHHVFGGIYGDLIFHLGAAARVPGVVPTAEQVSARQQVQARQRLRGWTRWLRGWTRWLPGNLRQLARSAYRRFLIPPEENPAARRKHFIAASFAEQMEVREMLMADPQGFINYLRTGRGEA